MKRKGFIMLAILILCFLWINGAWAETKGYIDYSQSSVGGVLGAKYTNTSGAAIRGSASASSGVTYGGYFLSMSTSGRAVFGYAAAETGATYGSEFWNDSTSGTGVYGYAAAESGANHGGYFVSKSTSGIGVRGSASASSGITYGGWFRSNSTSGRAVYGYAAAQTGYTYGGLFYSNSSSGRAVFGNAYAQTGYTYGGWFRSQSTSGTGVYGYALASSGYTYGGNFRSDSTSGRAVQGYATAASGKTFGGIFRSSSTSGVAVWGYATASTGSTAGVFGVANSPSGYGVYSQGNMRVVGNSYVTGSKSAVVKLNNGQSVSLYAVEASENWFEDFGSSSLKQGSALVKIDPTFAETVNTDIEYHVFLTPRGECNGLYVINQKGTSFEVRELNGGKSDISFSYRIVAKRKGYEDQRLARVNEDEMTAMAKNEEKNMHKDEAIELVSHVK